VWVCPTRRPHAAAPHGRTCRFPGRSVRRASGCVAERARGRVGASRRGAPRCSRHAYVPPTTDAAATVGARHGWLVVVRGGRSAACRALAVSGRSGAGVCLACTSGGETRCRASRTVVRCGRNDPITDERCTACTIVAQRCRETAPRPPFDTHDGVVTPDCPVVIHHLQTRAGSRRRHGAGRHRGRGHALATSTDARRMPGPGRRPSRPCGAAASWLRQPAKSASTKAFGSKSSRSSTRSPTPTNSTGTPIARSIEKAMPPFAVESSLVSAMPVSPLDS
jgi:hypothetical protein